MIDKLFIIAIAISLLFEGSFYFSLQLIYKSIEKKSFSIRNTFMFEVTPGFKDKNGFMNYMFLAGVIVSIAPYLYLAFKNANTFTVIIGVLSILLAFCLVLLPFISFIRLREHFYLSLGALVTLFSILVMESYYGFHLYKYYLDELYLTSGIVGASLALIALIGIVNPKLFDLKNEVDESGQIKRKKFIFLAFTEWMMYPLSILALVPMLLTLIQ